MFFEVLFLFKNIFEINEDPSIKSTLHLLLFLFFTPTNKKNTQLLF